MKMIYNLLTTNLKNAWIWYINTWMKPIYDNKEKERHNIKFFNWISVSSINIDLNKKNILPLLKSTPVKLMP